MLESDVYQGLLSKCGARGMGAYVSALARPYVVESDLEAGYKAMAADIEYNKEAQEWLEGMCEPVVGENNW